MGSGRVGEGEEGAVCLSNTLLCVSTLGTGCAVGDGVEVAGVGGELLLNMERGRRTRTGFFCVVGEVGEVGVAAAAGALLWGCA